MKGLALLLGGKGGLKGPPKPSADDSEDYEEGEESSDSEGSDEYARMVVEAMQDGDTEGAAKALKSLVRSCK